MKTKPRAIGTAAETAVCKYLVGHGFPHAERRSLKGILDQGDITGIPGVCVEVKGGAAAKTASDGQIDAWLTETETERRNARADLGVLIVQRAGYSADRAGSWWAVLTADTFCGFWIPSGSTMTPTAPVRVHLSTLTTLLRAAGYGQPLTSHELALTP